MEKTVSTIVIGHLDMSGSSAHPADDNRPDFHEGSGLASHLDLIGTEQVEADSSPGLLSKVESLGRKMSHLLALVVLPDQRALGALPGDLLSQGPSSDDPGFDSASEAGVRSTTVGLSVSRVHDHSGKTTSRRKNWELRRTKNSP